MSIRDTFHNNLRLPFRYILKNTAFNRTSDRFDFLQITKTKLSYASKHAAVRLFLLALLLTGLTINRLQAEYAFRGVWIATVANIDWPKVADPEQQQRDLKKMVDSLAAIGINNILFQVRPTADALYESQMEPTSQWLFLKQGDPLIFDPLDYLICLAHEKNIKVHAWINPYRVNINQVDPTQTYRADHIFNLKRQWFWQYGQQWLFNPALEQTRNWLCDIVEDILCHYDVDGIHMDDYFYPYPIGKTPLPDLHDFKQGNTRFKTIEDWRRHNVNKTVAAVHKTVKSHSKKIAFGISPFGVWRNKNRDERGSNTNAGVTNYDDLYADILLWIRKGWVDYIIPQLYWEIGKKNVDYQTLARWWAEQTTNTRTKLYIGMGVYRLEGPNEPQVWRQNNQIAQQMRLNRTIKNIKGECFYSASVLLRNPQGICDTLQNIYGKDQATTQQNITIRRTDKGNKIIESSRKNSATSPIK